MAANRFVTLAPLLVVTAVGCFQPHHPSVHTRQLAAPLWSVSGKPTTALSAASSGNDKMDCISEGGNDANDYKKIDGYEYVHFSIAAMLSTKSCTKISNAKEKSNSTAESITVARDGAQNQQPLQANFTQYADEKSSILDKDLGDPCSFFVDPETFTLHAFNNGESDSDFPTLGIMPIQDLAQLAEECDCVVFSRQNYETLLHQDSKISVEDGGIHKLPDKILGLICLSQLPFSSLPETSAFLDSFLREKADTGEAKDGRDPANLVATMVALNLLESSIRNTIRRSRNYFDGNYYTSNQNNNCTVHGKNSTIANRRNINDANAHSKKGDPFLKDMIEELAHISNPILDHEIGPTSPSNRQRIPPSSAAPVLRALLLPTHSRSSNHDMQYNSSGDRDITIDKHQNEEVADTDIVIGGMNLRNLVSHGFLSTVDRRWLSLTIVLIQTLDLSLGGDEEHVTTKFDENENTTSLPMDTEKLDQPGLMDEEQVTNNFDENENTASLPMDEEKLDQPDLLQTLDLSLGGDEEQVTNNFCENENTTSLPMDTEKLDQPGLIDEEQVANNFDENENTASLPMDEEKLDQPGLVQTLDLSLEGDEEQVTNNFEENENTTSLPMNKEKLDQPDLLRTLDLSLEGDEEQVTNNFCENENIASLPMLMDKEKLDQPVGMPSLTKYYPMRIEVCHGKDILLKDDFDASMRTLEIQSRGQRNKEMHSSPPYYCGNKQFVPDSHTPLLRFILFTLAPTLRQCYSSSTEQSTIVADESNVILDIGEQIEDALIIPSLNAIFVTAISSLFEHSLRLAWCRANHHPDDCIARPSQYYVTLDGHGQRDKHDVMISPLLRDGISKNQMTSVIGSPAFAILADLFAAPSSEAPNIRSAVCHGTLDDDIVKELERLASWAFQSKGLVSYATQQQKEINPLLVDAGTALISSLDLISSNICGTPRISKYRPVFSYTAMGTRDLDQILHNIAALNTLISNDSSIIGCINTLERQQSKLCRGLRSLRTDVKVIQDMSFALFPTMTKATDDSWELDDIFHEHRSNAILSNIIASQKLLADVSEGTKKYLYVVQNGINILSTEPSCTKDRRAIKSMSRFCGVARMAVDLYSFSVFVALYAIKVVAQDNALYEEDSTSDNHESLSREDAVKAVERSRMVVSTFDSFLATNLYRSLTAVQKYCQGKVVKKMIDIKRSL